MYNELTEVDIKKMQEEIDYRMKVVRPKCIEDLKTARGFGDLSENYEYKAAKQELPALPAADDRHREGDQIRHPGGGGGAV